MMDPYELPLTDYFSIEKSRNLQWIDENVHVIPVATPVIRLEPESLNEMNCSSDVIRSTFTKFPRNRKILNESGLPCGFIVHPFGHDKPNYSPKELVSCFQCDAYINPFCVVAPNGYEWTCNFCSSNNNTKRRKNTSPISFPVPNSVEFRNKSEKRKKAETYIFLLDVSHAAINTGYLKLFSKILIDHLNGIKSKNPTARVGFITYNNEVHLYKMNYPHMDALEKWIFSDLEDMDKILGTTIDQPSHFLMKVGRSKKLIVRLLLDLCEEYANGFQTLSAMGSALQAAHRIIEASGGRVTVFQTSIPSAGIGDLSKSCEMINITKNCSFKAYYNYFYEQMAGDCLSQDITVDLFIFGKHFMDLSTLCSLSDETGGSTFRFPGFHVDDAVQRQQLEQTFGYYLTRPIGFTSKKKIHMTQGLSIKKIFGVCSNLSELESQTNVVYPEFNFAFNVDINDKLFRDQRRVCCQAVMSYFSRKGNKLTRVYTLCLPIADDVTEVIESVDQECVIGLMARFTAFWMKDSTTVCETQKRLSNLCLKFLLMYNNSTEHPENLTTKPLIMPSNLSLLPFYTATILNSVIFQPVKTALSLDECIHLLDQFNSMPLNQLIQFVKGSQNDDQKFYVDFLTGLHLKLRYQQPWNVIPKLRSKIRSYWYQTNEQSTNPV